MNHLTERADPKTFPRILWTTLWETTGGWSEVLDFQRLSALLKKPATAGLYQ
jgi:hypothetical protein